MKKIVLYNLLLNIKYFMYMLHKFIGYIDRNTNLFIYLHLLLIFWYYHYYTLQKSPTKLFLVSLYFKIIKISFL